MSNVLLGSFSQVFFLLMLPSLCELGVLFLFSAPVELVVDGVLLAFFFSVLTVLLLVLLMQSGVPCVFVWLVRLHQSRVLCIYFVRLVFRQSNVRFNRDRSVCFLLLWTDGR